jgi:hypothetical protein
MSVRVFYEILNQRGTPAMFTDTLANRPAFGFAGRLFISTDSGQIFEDTGSAWTLVADAGVGGGTLSSVCLNGNTTATGIVITAGGLSTNSLTNTSLTTGSILFADGGGLISQSNSTFFWDNTNKRLGIGTASPSGPLDIHATGTNAYFNGTGSNNAYLQFQNAGVSKWRIGNTYSSGANSFDIYNNGLATSAISIQSSSNDITLTGNLNNTGKVISTGAIVSNSILSVINNGSVTGTNGYSSFSGNLANNGFTFAPNNTNYVRFIVPTSANYDYTFPAATGTIALTSNIPSLTGYVPYTGANAPVNLGLYDLTALYLAVSQDGDSKGGYINFKQCTSVNNGSIGNTNIFALNSTQFGICYMQSSGLNKTAIFDASSITTGNVRTFTFPDTSGTLALTSQISGYLPLTGGTLTGQLYINPTNTGVTGLDVASDTVSFRSDNLEGNKRQLLITMSSGTLIKFQAQGYGATYGTDLGFYTSAAGGVNSSPAMYITGGNNVGIGTGSVTDFGSTYTVLDVYNATVGGYILARSPNVTGQISVDNNTSMSVQTRTNHPITFNPNNAEKMRLTTAGLLLINRTATGGQSAKIQINTTAGEGVLVQQQSAGGYCYASYGVNNGGTYYFQYFQANSTQVGDITSNGTTTSYNITSDYRLKQDLKDFDGLNLICNIKTYDYQWKLDNSRMYGVIAHELQEILPYAVNGIKDGEKMQGVDYSKLVPILVKAIQELNEKLVRNNIN